MIRRVARSIVLKTPLEKPARAILRSLRESSNESSSFVPQTFKSFVLPDGMTEQDLRDVFLSFSLDHGPIGQLDPYVHDALYRFIHSWQLVKNEFNLQL